LSYPFYADPTDIRTGSGFQGHINGIEAALVRALSESRFEPATLRGSPVEVVMMLPASVASSR